MPWFNSDLRRLKKNKDQAHRKAKTSQNPNDWANFRQIRNDFANKLRESESEYKEKLAPSLKESQHVNPQKWWHINKQVMGKSKNNTIPPMTENNKTYFDTNDKANAFNEAFLSFSKLDTSHTRLPETT